MGFVFTKAKKYNHINMPDIEIKKSANEKTKLLNKLRSFLDKEEPKIVKLILSFWNRQQETITYEELKEAYLNGYITKNQIRKWQEDYSRLIMEKFAPEWNKAMERAAEDMYMRYSYSLYDPNVWGAKEYIISHGAELVTQLVREQKDALNAMLRQGTYYDALTVDEISMMMRPCIGLTVPQSKANMNYYNNVKKALIKSGIKKETAKKKAADKAAEYAGKQHRYRAMNIARTELATAYNQGGYLATKDAQSRGYIGKVKKVWLTASDERVCPVCGMADGEECNMEAIFSMGKKLPPAHPSCRCAVAYEEVGLLEDFAIQAFDDNNGIGVENTDENSIIEYRESKTIKEANDFAKNDLGIPNVEYKGVDITTANEWNKGLTDTFNRFPELKKNFGFVGECHERNKALKPVVRQYYQNWYMQKNPTCTLSQLQPYIDKAVNSYMRAMSIPKNTMAESWSPKLMEFQKFKGVTINSVFGKNSLEFVKILEDCVSIKFHPEGCSTIRSVLDHEIGHQLDDLLKISDIPEIQKLYNNMTKPELTKTLSQYAWQNNNTNCYKEMIAEAWAEYCNNPTPRDIAKEIGQTIEKQYKLKFTVKEV